MRSWAESKDRRQQFGTTANPHQISVQRCCQQTGQEAVEDLRLYLHVTRNAEIENNILFILSISIWYTLQICV